MSTADKTYNGWTNYETWAVMLHLDNDEGTYTMVRDSVAEIVASRNEAGGRGEQPFYASYVADWLKDYAETLCGVGSESEDYGIPEPTLLATDMIRAALSEVDWNEMASHVLSES